MRILVIGATGFIGRELVKELECSGHQVVAVSRNARKARALLGSELEIVEWDGRTAVNLAIHLTGIDAIINLAGENIASGRWTDRQKKLISLSRVETGQLLSEAVKLSPDKPAALIQGSAIGFYGPHVEVPADENQAGGTGFMAGLVKAWESSIIQVQNIIPRVVIIRTGLVLGNNGGLMEKMLLPFKFYCGTVIGSGNQWMSWIHIRDEVRAIRFLLESNTSSGPYNLTSPNPVQMKTFIKSISITIKKPAWIRVPGMLLKTVLGEMAEETILSSLDIIPGKLLHEGFKFEYPHLAPALNSLLLKENP